MRTLAASILLLFASLVHSQNIGINATGAAPDGSALLDISAVGSPIKGGLLIPRMNSAERNAIPTPALSLFIYNTSTDQFEYWDGGQWQSFINTSDAWNLNGNVGIDAFNDFLGTTDSKPLVFRTNNVERLRVAVGGNVGIGTSTPSDELHVEGSIRIVDGNETAGHILTSDANGTGTWEEPRQADHYAAVGVTSITASQAFQLMADMMVSLSPKDSVLIVHFSAAGPSIGCQEQLVSFQLLVNGAVVTSFHTTVEGASLGPRYDVGNSMTIPVTPGLPTTIVIRWVAVNCSGSVRNGPTFNTSPVGSHRSLLVIDPNGSGQTSYVGPPATTSSWNLGGNSATTAGSDYIGTNDYQSLVFKTNAIERMRLSSSGWLGIGTSLPTTPLHVAGNIRMVDGNQAAGTLLTSSANGTGSWTDPANFVSMHGWGLAGNAITNPNSQFLGTSNNQDLVFRTNNIERMRVNNTGMLGIGTNNPIRLLHLESNTTSNSTAQLYLRQTGTGDALMHIGIATGNYYNIGVDNSDGDKFKIGSTSGFPSSVSAWTLLTLEPAGNLGLGTTTPDRDLEIEGTGDQFVRATSIGGTRISGFELKRQGNGYFDWRIRNQSGNMTFSHSPDDFVNNNDIFTFGSTFFRPVPNGTVSLGGSVNRWSTVFAVNGTINTSDARDKTNVKDLAYGLNEVMQLRPVSFKWIDNEETSTKIGLIAQELQTVLPEVVRDWDWSEPEEGQERVKVDADRLGVYYSDIIPVLVNSIQELKEMLDAQNAEIERLKQELKQ